jgi:hypothetical protein
MQKNFLTYQTINLFHQCDPFPLLLNKIRFFFANLLLTEPKPVRRLGKKIRGIASIAALRQHCVTGKYPEARQPRLLENIWQII